MEGRRSLPNIASGRLQQTASSSSTSHQATKIPMSSQNADDDIETQRSSLQQRVQDLQASLQAMRNQQQQTVEEMAQVQYTYLCGLDKIAKLQDLRDAPDAYMPGNH